MPEAAGRVGRRPGPKPRLTRDDVVEAAVAVGVERLSAAAVAEHLGVAPGSLYRYVAGMDELAAAAVERLFARLPLPDATAGWRAFLEAEAELRYDLLLRYSGLVRESAADLTAVAVARVEAIVGVLREAGFDLDTAMLVSDAVLDVVDDGVDQTVSLRGDTDPEGLSAHARAVLAAYSPEVRTATRRIMDDPRAHVLRKVALILDGAAERRGLSRS